MPFYVKYNTDSERYMVFSGAEKIGEAIDVVGIGDVICCAQKRQSDEISDEKS